MDKKYIIEYYFTLYILHFNGNFRIFTLENRETQGVLFHAAGRHPAISGSTSL